MSTVNIYCVSNSVNTLQVTIIIRPTCKRHSRAERLEIIYTTKLTNHIALIGYEEQLRKVRACYNQVIIFFYFLRRQSSYH